MHRHSMRMPPPARAPPWHAGKAQATLPVSGLGGLGRPRPLTHVPYQCWADQISARKLRTRTPACPRGVRYMYPSTAVCEPRSRLTGAVVNVLRRSDASCLAFSRGF